jgi:Xaa-Pro aminopeptidase
VETLRLVKTPEEIDRIANAAGLADAAFEHALEGIAAGRTELEIALDIEVFLRTSGSEGVPFTPIVAAGEGSAQPHAIAGGRVLRAGDMVKLDLGARQDGYCSDLTRTVVVGRPSDRLRSMHEAVLAANRAGIAAARGGVPASDIDEAARDVLEERGLGGVFGHGVGHGVGLEVHEAPRLARGSTDSVPAGAVVTVEPGAYVDGFGGVRIEDLVVVEEDGARVLSEAPRELLEL